MQNNNQDWETLLNFLDVNDQTDFIDVEINQNKFENQNQFNTYYTDYKKLVSIDSILKSKD